MNLETAKQLTGTKTNMELAAKLGVSRVAVGKWDANEIPRKQELEIERPHLEAQIERLIDTVIELNKVIKKLKKEAKKV